MTNRYPSSFAVRMLLQLAVALTGAVVLLTPIRVEASSLADWLLWQPSLNLDVVGYVIHVGDDPGFFGAGGGDSVDIGDDYSFDGEVAGYPLSELLDRSGYVVIQAYDAQGLHSIASNEFFVSIEAGCEGEACGGGTNGRLMYDENFESYGSGADPRGWVDTALGNSMAGDGSLFATRSTSADSVFFETTSEKTNAHTHFTGDDSHGWSNYEFAGRMRISDARGGIGLTLYSDYPQSDSYYRLRRYDGLPTLHISNHGSSAACVGATDTGVSPRAGEWTRFRFQAESVGDGTQLRAKVWGQSEAEPAYWQADCVVAGAGFSSGAPGFWIMGPGAKAWDDLTVSSLGKEDISQVACEFDSDCGDDNVCTGVERCVEGLCVAGQSLSCGGHTQCTRSTCDAQIGCVQVPVANGLSCSDADLCTGNDTCQSGVCTSGGTLSCGDVGPCRVGWCDSSVGCASEPIANGTTCDDGNQRTEFDACFQGVCHGVMPEDSSEEPGETPEDSEPGDGEMLYFDDFEDNAAGDDPRGWFDTNKSNSMYENAGLFEIMETDGGNRAFATRSTSTNIHSHYLAGGSPSWWDYEYFGQMRTSHSDAGIGVTIFSDFPNSDSYLRLRRYQGSRTFTLSPHAEAGQCVGSSDTGVDPEANSWYSFRFRAVGPDGAARVQAKVWKRDAPEPEAWQIDCLWDGSVPTEGSPGVWSMGPGVKYWDDLGAIELTEPASGGDTEPDADLDDSSIYYENFDAYSIGDEARGWVHTGEKSSTEEEAGLFAVAPTSESNLALSTRSDARNIHSHLVDAGAESWSNYEYSGRMRADGSTAGVGVTLYSSFPDADSYYRLRSYSGNPIFRLSGRASAPLTCERAGTGVFRQDLVWYRFRIRAYDVGAGVRILAKVWDESHSEPLEWQAECLAEGDARLEGGAPGVWSMGAGQKFWDDLNVRPILAADQ